MDGANHERDPEGKVAKLHDEKGGIEISMNANISQLNKIKSCETKKAIQNKRWMSTRLKS